MDIEKTLQHLGSDADVAFDANQYYSGTEIDYNINPSKNQSTAKNSNDNQNSDFLKVSTSYDRSEDESKDVKDSTHEYKDKNDSLKRSSADVLTDREELSSDVYKERVTDSNLTDKKKSDEGEPIAVSGKNDNEKFCEQSGKTESLMGMKTEKGEMDEWSNLIQDDKIELYIERGGKSNIDSREDINKDHKKGLKQNLEKSGSEMCARIMPHETHYCASCWSQIRNCEKCSDVPERLCDGQQKQDTLRNASEKRDVKQGSKIDEFGKAMKYTERTEEKVENYVNKQENFSKTGDSLCSKELLSTKNSNFNAKTTGKKLEEDSKTYTDIPNNYLFIGGSAKAQKSYDVPIVHRGKLTSSSKSGYNKGVQKRVKTEPDIKTLEDALRYFGLSSHLQKLETSLEDVRRRKKSKEDHETYLKQLDKEMQKLSFDFHPDRVKNKGGSEEEITEAQKLQTALNATRTVLNMLNATLLEDLSTDHKYGFYTKLSISSLGNEDKIKSHVYEVFFKIGLMSEIKQQNIIAEIRKFLSESKKCVKSYFECDPNEFEKYRDSAFFHLKSCIKGYKKLCIEFNTIEEECKYEKLDNIYSLVRKMASDSSRDLYQLKLLKKAAKKSLSGRYQFFNPSEPVDKYFVSPFLYYTNVILMCNVMMKNTSFFESILSNMSTDVQLDPKYNEDLCELIVPYYLASYCSGNKQHTRTVFQIMGKAHLYQNRQATKYELSKDEIRNVFYSVLFEANLKMEPKFNVDDYIEGRSSTKDQVTEELKKCMRLMNDFQKKEQELSNDIKKFKKKTREMDEKYDKIMKKNEECNKEVMERLLQSKEILDKISTALSEQP